MNPYDRVRVVTNRFEAEGAPAGSIGYLIESYPGDKFEVEVSDPSSGVTVAQFVADADELEEMPLADGTPPIPGLLGLMEAWFLQRHPVLAAAGIAMTFTSGSEDRDKRAAWMDFESSRGAGRLQLWDSGEAELGVGVHAADGFKEVLQEHREITAAVGLDGVEATVRVWLSDPDPVPPGHVTEIVERGTLVRWRCSCGASTSGRWNRSPEEALKAAERHVTRAGSES